MKSKSIYDAESAGLKMLYINMGFTKEKAVLLLNSCIEDREDIVFKLEQLCIDQ